MKKINALQFLLAFLTFSATASTGERSDDYLVLLVPFVFLSIVYCSYEVKRRIAIWKKRREEEQILLSDHEL